MNTHSSCFLVCSGCSPLPLALELFISMRNWAATLRKAWSTYLLFTIFMIHNCTASANATATLCRIQNASSLNTRMVSLALFDTHVFLLSEYFIELDTPNFKILNTSLNWIFLENWQMNWILSRTEKWINIWIEFCRKKKIE